MNIRMHLFVNVREAAINRKTSWGYPKCHEASRPTLCSKPDRPLHQSSVGAGFIFAGRPACWPRLPLSGCVGNKRTSSEWTLVFLAVHTHSEGWMICRSCVVGINFSFLLRRCGFCVCLASPGRGWRGVILITLSLGSPSEASQTDRRHEPLPWAPSLSVTCPRVRRLQQPAPSDALNVY